MFRMMTVALVSVAPVVFAGNSARAQCATQPVPTSPLEVAVPCSGTGCEAEQRSHSSFLGSASPTSAASPRSSARSKTPTIPPTNASKAASR